MNKPSPRSRRPLWPLMLLPLSLLTSCAHPTSSNSLPLSSECGITLKPIYWSPKWTDDQIRAAKENNARYLAICSPDGSKTAGPN